MAITKGLKTTLNQIRELSTELYQEQVPNITDSTTIESWGSPILNDTIIQNEFINNLINRIVYTQFEIKYFRNPLRVLEGDRIPLGYQGQEIYVNPAQGRKFNTDDFAGILAKYEADVKVQYMNINSDVQYPVTILRQSLKQAFVSWGDLETFIDQLSNSLYNGAYIDAFKNTKNLITSAYVGNKAQIEVVPALSTEAIAKEFITKARGLYLNFQTPSSQYNAWSKMGGNGRPIVTFTNPEDIVFIIRNDIRAYIDVNVLSSAFNIDKTTLLGNIITVDNFNVYDENGTVTVDGSPIIGMIADKSWFRIKTQDMFMDTFYNPNNRTWQYYLNLIKMYNMSLFANGVIFATSAPNNIPVTNITTTTTKLLAGENLVNLEITPPNFTGELQATVDTANKSKVTVNVTNNNNLQITVANDASSSIQITLTAGSYTKELSFSFTPTGS